jgi:phospholipase D1/2
MKARILKQGQNCWCIDEIKELSLLIDGDNYFKAFFDAAEQAKRSIKIVGFELESWLGLAHISRRFPNSLRRYFTRLTNEKKDLQVSIRCWNAFSFLSLEREKLAAYKWKFKTPERVRFRHVRHSLVYGSYHEKFSLIDGCCAFLGGMDISQKRWDTPEHLPKNHLRKDGQGKIYNPVHDIQLVCTGPLIKKLEEYQQENKNERAGEKAEVSRIWPRTHPPQVKDITGAISRTDAASGVLEIEQLYLDAIEQAERYILIENQYLTNFKIIEQLCRRLEQKEGPEVIIVGPLSYPGSFEKAIYLHERNLALAMLRHADKFGRFLGLYPTLPEEDPEKFLVVHSKVMMADDEFITIGSANISRRSMRVDSEVNISLESAGDQKIKSFVKSNVCELLSEHLGITAQEFASHYTASGSLLKSVKHFMGRHTRTLRPLPEAQLKIHDRAMLLLTPFVELQYAMPKAHAYSLLVIFLLMGMIFIQGYE